MAQKVEVRLEDDLDGDPAKDTITFGLDGKSYEIDLSTVNAETLRSYAAASRRTTRGGGTRNTRARASRGHSDTPKIRAWAERHGREVSERGRVNQVVKDAYYATC